MKTRTIVLTLVGLIVLAASAIAKEKEYLDGTILDVQKNAARMRSVKMGGNDWWKFTVKVGDTIYVAYYKKQGMLDRGAHAEDFPVNSPVKVRFESSRLAKIAGWEGYFFIQRPDGKEMQAFLWSHDENK